MELLRLKHVSVVLVWVVLVLHWNHSADSAQPAQDPSDRFVDLQGSINAPESFWGINNSANCTPNDMSFLRTDPPYAVNNRTASTCVYPAPIRFKDNPTGPVYSFSVQFLASVVLGSPPPSLLGYDGTGFSTKNGLEGFTFAILPNDHGAGGDGGYLGLLNATSQGNNQSHTLAVEFDFVESPQFADPVGGIQDGKWHGGYHVGLDINSMNSTPSTPLIISPEYYTTSQNGFDLPSLQVWIDYDGASKLLNVTTIDVTGLDCPMSDTTRDEMALSSICSFSKSVDLSNVLNEHMYFGFTSSVSPGPTTPPLGLSGGVGSGVAVQSWSFRTSNSTSNSAARSAPLPCFSFPRSFYERYASGVKLVAILGSLSTMAVIYAAYKYYKRRVEIRGWRFNIDADDLQDADPHKFTYKELALATKNFAPSEELGRGGFGSVYKGFLPGNKQHVAIKRVAPDSSQGEREFLAEVMIIGKIRHRNLVRLQGWCHEKGELLLVYDYMPHGSLDKLLFGKHVTPEEVPSANSEQELELVAVDIVNEVRVRFPWERRFKVIVDVAKALVYLHTECEERIIHRDVKAANVMLDAKFNARLGDFGLARSYNHSLLIPESTMVAGTLGYLAPELFHTFKQTEQTDVYSFGAFLLEVACGRKPIYREEEGVGLLVDHVWMMWGNSHILATADPQLGGVYDAQEMTKVLCVGLLCSHPSPAMRPSMRQVLLILNGDVALPNVPLSRPRVDHTSYFSLLAIWYSSIGSISPGNDDSHAPHACD